MEAIPNRSETLARQTVARCFLGALVFLSFFVYPLGIFPQILTIGHTVFFNLIYAISLPGVIMLGLLAVPVMLFFRWRLKPLLLMAVVVFSIMLLWNVPREMEYLDDFLVLIGYVTIPIAAAILLESGHLTLNRIAGWASALWLVQIIVGGIALYRQMQPVGTPGNINWMAGLLLMLSPWVIWFLIQTVQCRMKNRRMAALLAVLVWLVPTAFILYHCHSRAAWLTVCLFPLFLGVVRLQRTIHKMLLTGILVIGGLGCIVAAYVWFPSSLLRVVEKDIRIPLWTGTSVMIIKQPLGVGSGGYQKHFTPFRKVSSYHYRLFAADMTVHPHNEILNVGAQLGIPALLAFLIMISQIGRSAFKDPLQTCARISAYFVVMSSMFDMQLVQPPGNFLGLFVLGLCWPIQVDSGHTAVKTPALFTAKVLFVGLLMAGALIICCMDVTHDIHLRRGKLNEHIANSHIAQNRPEEGQKSLRDAIAMYKQSVIPFSSVVPFYKIGRLSLRLPDNTDQAETYLNRVAAIDPNFSHLNLLFGQLNLQRRNLAAAERFFTRECNLFPRSDKAWQNMYTFATATGQCDHSITIDALLGDIYRERARQNFGKTGLAEKQKLFTEAMHDGNMTEALRLAQSFFTRINHNFTDALLLEITMGETLPASFFIGGFNTQDAAMWHLRHTMFSTLKQEVSPLPVAPEALVAWFSRFIQIQDTDPLSLPISVWQRRAGSPLSVYLLFSMLCELNRITSIICLDSEGLPAGAYLFVKESVQDALTSENRGVTGKSTAGVSIFLVDLLSKGCKAISRADFRKNFRWTPGQTIVYYPMADFFLRNQILGILIKPDLSYLPQHPPGIRLIELFTLTESPPPPLSILKNYCFDKHIRQYHDIIRSNSQ